MSHDHHHHAGGGDEPFERALERMNRFQEPEARRAIAELSLPAGSRGLDVGCGVGLFTAWLAEHVGPAGRVVGIEPKADRVDAARALTANAPAAARVEFRQGDGLAIDVRDGAFDWLWCGDVLHHIQDTGAALAEFRRVVRPGGLIAVKESQVAPAVFLPGHPELERRLQAAEIEFSREEAGAQPFVERRQRTPAAMRAAGLVDVGLRTYLIQRRAPLDAATREYVERTLFGRNWGPRLVPFLDEQDWQRRSALCEPASPEYVLASPDYYCLYTFCVFTARR